MVKRTGKKVINLFQNFLKTEQASGVILIACTVVSLAIANSPLGPFYDHLWHLKIGWEEAHLKMSVNHWINDGLMAIFFLLVGLEIKREIIEGELSSIKKSALPILAAIGGMVVPAVIYAIFNYDKPSASGWGIPMATDIAFAVGIMGMLGKRVPFALKVMVTALAIVDDLGAIIVIAIFYTSDLSLKYLGIALAMWGLLLVFNRMGVKSLALYLFVGVFLWYFMLLSHVHATIAGVLLAFALPLGKGQTNSAAENLQHAIEKPVGYIIMPIFALSNTGFIIESSLIEIIESPASIGIVLGLLIGKPLGIFSFSWFAIKAKMANLPTLTNYKQLLGAGFLGGIGFTMSIFIALLAFDNEALQVDAKLSILIGSVLSGVAGYLMLRK